MKYIRNRNQFRNTEKIFEEAPSEQIYDGTWEDTFVGRFFSFLGRKAIYKIKKGGLNKLLKQLEGYLEEITFLNKAENESEEIQYYKLYQYIAVIKSYIKNSKDVSIDELTDKVEKAVEEHDKSSKNKDLSDKFRKAHLEIKNKFQNFLNYIKDIDTENISERYSSPLGKKSGEIEPGDALIQKMLLKGDLNLLNISLIGNQSRYKESIREIKNKLLEIKDIFEKKLKLDYIDEKVKGEYEEFVNLVKNAPFNDYSSFSKLYDKEIVPKIKELLKIQEKHDEVEEIKKDPNKILIKWINSKGKKIVGYTEDKNILEIIGGNNKIDIDTFNASKEDFEKSKIFIIIPNRRQIMISNLGDIIKRNDIIQIGDTKIEGVYSSEGDITDNDEVEEFEEETDETDDTIKGSIKEDINQKIDEIFTNDEEYKKYMDISDETLEKFRDSIKAKKEDQRNVVDPINILKVFNRAYNSMTITKEDYNDLSSRYSPKVASRKKARYELIGDTARNKKLFQEWNDGVLSLLQQYGDLLNKPTKQFIVEMLDSNNLFNDGGQAKLLSKYFDIPIDKAKSRVSNINIDDSPSKHSVEETEDKKITFIKGKNMELNNTKTPRLPFIIKARIDGNSEFLTIYPLKAKTEGQLLFKFSRGNDYGFLKKYLENSDKEFVKPNIYISDDNKSDVYFGHIETNSGFIEPNNNYTIKDIKNLTNRKSVDNIQFNPIEFYVLAGENDKKVFKLPKMTDTLKSKISSDSRDSLIKSESLKWETYKDRN